VKTLFISYRQESLEHARSVRQLALLLRQAKIPVELDQLYLNEHAGGPNEGWPQWCEHHANKCEAVLIVASRGWFASYERKEAPGVGCGAAAEAALFQQYLYDEKGENLRIRLAIIDDLPKEEIPPRLRPWQSYKPFASSGELDRLVAWVTQQLGLKDVESPTIRWPKPLPDFEPDIANRHLEEWPAIRDMLSGKLKQRILLLEAESGYGKSELLRQSMDYAKRLGIPVCRLDFRANFSGVDEILGRLDTDLGQHLSNFSREGGNKTHLLIKDLRALRGPVLLLLDSFEKASGVFQDWVCQNLMAEVEGTLAMTMIVAGQPPLPDAWDIRWRAVAQRLPLGPINEAALWKPWIEKRYPGFREREVDLPTLVMASGGVPKTFSDLCRVIAGQPALPTR